MQTLSARPDFFTFLVWERFLNQPEKFDKYSKILRDMCSRRENLTHGLSKLKKTFADHKDLLILLNNFLPEKHHSIRILDFHKNEQDSPLESTIKFVNKVHDRFGNIDNGRDFIKFCDIMSLYKNKKLKIDAVDSLLNVLFQNHPELYMDFTRIMVDELQKQEDFEHYNPVIWNNNCSRIRKLMRKLDDTNRAEVQWKEWSTIVVRTKKYQDVWSFLIRTYNSINF